MGARYVGWGCGHRCRCVGEVAVLAREVANLVGVLSPWCEGRRLEGGVEMASGDRCATITVNSALLVRRERMDCAGVPAVLTCVGGRELANHKQGDWSWVAVAYRATCCLALSSPSVKVLW